MTVCSDPPVGIGIGIGIAVAIGEIRVMAFGHEQDVLEVCAALSERDNAKAKDMLDRIVAMLTRLGKRGYTVHESAVRYGHVDCDSDTDADTDSD